MSSTTNLALQHFKYFWVAFGIALAASSPGPLFGQDFLSAAGPKNPVRIDQSMGRTIPLDLEFRDESGKIVRLGDYFKSGRPVVLTPVYYRCPMLCNMVLDGLTTTLSNIKLDLGRDYEVVTFSFDPRDTPADARAKKAIFTKRYAHPGANEGWHFLTGEVASIRELTNAIGFRYEYDEKTGQFAHGATVVVLTPDGKISRYFHGFEYRDRDVRLGLVEASEKRIGSAVDQVMLLCYSYDPATGRYAAVAMNFVRAGGVLTVLGIVGFVVWSSRRRRESEEGGPE